MQVDDNMLVHLDLCNEEDVNLLRDLCAGKRPCNSIFCIKGSPQYTKAFGRSSSPWEWGKKTSSKFLYSWRIKEEYKETEVSFDDVFEHLSPKQKQAALYLMDILR